MWSVRESQVSRALLPCPPTHPIDDLLVRESMATCSTLHKVRRALTARLNVACGTPTAGGFGGENLVEPVPKTAHGE